MEALDEVLGGLLAAWDDEAGLVLMTSDHGNLEDLSGRGHTTHAVPALIIGVPVLRQRFAAGLRDLTDVAPAILRLLAAEPHGEPARQATPSPALPGS